MGEISNLTELAKKLQESKAKELKQVQQIEQEKLADLTISLKRSYQNAVDTIEVDMTERLSNLQKAMTEARHKIMEEEKAMLKKIKVNRLEIEEEATSLHQSIARVKAKYWITPLMVGLSLTTGLMLGLWGMGVIITDRNQELAQVNEQISKTKQSLKTREIEIEEDYLILPRGLTAQTGYSTKDGREAIKMTR